MKLIPCQKQQTSCTIEQMQDAMKFFSGGVYTPKLQPAQWGSLIEKLNSHGFTAYEFLYFVIHHAFVKADRSRMRYHNVLLGEKMWSDFLSYMALSNSGIGAIVNAQAKAFHSRLGVGITIQQLLLGTEVPISPPLRIDLARAMCSAGRLSVADCQKVERLCAEQAAYVIKGNRLWLHHCKYLTEKDAMSTGDPVCRI